MADAATDRTQLLLPLILDAAASGDAETAHALADLAIDLRHEAAVGLGDPDSPATKASAERVAARMREYVRGKMAAGVAPSPDVTEGVGAVTSADFATVNGQRVSEACVANKVGKGHHDDETGHPCKDGGDKTDGDDEAISPERPLAGERNGSEAASDNSHHAGPATVELSGEDAAAADRAGMRHAAFAVLKRLIRPATIKDLRRPTIMLWHGTTKEGAKGIKADGGLRGGSRGRNATISPLHASQYPEDTGAHSLVLLRADTSELEIDPNDTIGDTVESGLFPRRRWQSSCTVGSAHPVAIFNVQSATQKAIDALERGDLAGAILDGARVTIVRRKTPQ